MWRDLRDFLVPDCRPVGLPGPAAAGGVPADQSAELAAELEPPLVSLEETEAEAQAVQTAAWRRPGAVERPNGLRRTSSNRPERVHPSSEQSAALVRDATKAEATELLAAAARDTAALRRRMSSARPHSWTVWWTLDKELTAPDDERQEGGPPPWAPAR